MLSVSVSFPSEEMFHIVAPIFRFPFLNLPAVRALSIKVRRTVVDECAGRLEYETVGEASREERRMQDKPPV